jgi:hypothetical protein
MSTPTPATFNEFLIGALEALAARPLTTRKDLAAWRAEAHRLEESFTPEQADSVPSFVWHYLGDADIRLRNASYREDQQRRLRQVVQQLGPRAPRFVVRRRS